jgi:putative PIN family toxin of toxin-antitoxin system
MTSGGKRFVFDTNVLVSALLLADSTPGAAFQAALSEGTILLSETVFKELNQVLSRAKFERYLLWDERQRFLAAFLMEAKLVEIRERVSACRDPGDNHILELAVNGKADYIVSGDNDLLALNPFRNIPILSPAQFLTSMGR